MPNSPTDAELEQMARDAVQRWTDTAVSVHEVVLAALKSVRDRSDQKPVSPSDTEMLDWLDKHGAENVRGTDYPQWRVEGDYDQTLRDAIRKEMAGPEPEVKP